MGPRHKLSSLPLYHSVVISSVASAVLLGGTFLPTALQSVTHAWESVGALRLAAWHLILDQLGENQFWLWIAGASFMLIVWYWFIGALYTLLDVTLKPEVFRKYKIQLGTNEPVDKKTLRNSYDWVPPTINGHTIFTCGAIFFYLRFVFVYLHLNLYTHEHKKKVITQVLFNQFVVGLPTIYLGARLFMWRGPPPVRELPPSHLVILQLLFCLFEQEVAYYYVHRLLHSKYLYRWVHKRHHEWTAPIAITAIYCHPVEQVCANLLPPFLGLFILNAHVSTYWLWFFLAVLFTLSEHSGYHLPFMTSPEVHDFHHSSFINNFGFLGILDSLHGTDLLYKQSMAYPRHFVLKDTRSAREVVPDKPKNQHS